MLKINTVITKKAGFNVPTQLFVNILNRKPTAFGFAVQDPNGKSGRELSILHQSKMPTIAELEGWSKEARDFNALLCFGELGNKFDPMDIQPFVLNDGNMKPFMALGFDGDFKVEPDKAHTDDYVLATKAIIPTLIEICDKVGADPEKVMSILNDDRMNQSFLEQVSHRGVMTIFPLEGDALTFAKNDLGGEYDWGTTTQRHKFDDVSQEPAAEEKPKGFAFSFGKKQDVSPPALPKEAVKPKASVPEVRSDGKNLPQPVKLPDWVHKNDDKRTWYSMVAGEIPENGWKKGIPVIPVIPADKMPKDLADLKAWEAEELKRKLRSGDAVKAQAEPIKAPATATAAPGPTKVEEPRSLIDAKSMEKLIDVVDKIVKDSEAKPMSIKDMMALEKRIGAFSESVGVDPKDTINWPMSGLFAIANTDIKGIVMLAMEYRKLWRDTLDVKDLSGSTVVKTTEKLGDNTVKTESIVRDHVLAKDELKPEKKAGFSFGQKKVA